VAEQEATFFQAVQTVVAAVEISTGVKAFARVWIQPGQSVDVPSLLRIPRFPCAVLNEGGFGVNISNGKVVSGTFTVTVCDVKPRDPHGEAALLRVMDIGNKLAAALEYSTADAVYRALGAAGSSSQFVGGMMIVMRSYAFSYELRRA
jgi:hypothetical protein